MRQVDEVARAVAYLKSRGHELSISRFYEASAEYVLAQYRANPDVFAQRHGHLFVYLTRTK